MDKSYAGSLVLLCALQALHIVVVCFIDYDLLQRLAAAGSERPEPQAEAKAAGAPASEGAGAGEAGGAQAAVEPKVVVLQLEEEEEQGERPLLSYRELLLNHEFIVAALTAALSFCAMTALMSVTPIAMRVSAGAGPGQRRRRRALGLAAAAGGRRWGWPGQRALPLRHARACSARRCSTGGQRAAQLTAGCPACRTTCGRTTSRSG
jgi:hypothetical protein